MGHRLIIAEDEELERTALQLIIRTQLPQYDICAQAATGIELLEKCHVHKPDVILMDISMPVLNGLDAMKQLLVTFPNLKFIVLSAHADFYYAQTALKLGAFDYLTKPIKTDVLISSLGKLAELLLSTTHDSYPDEHLNEQIKLALPQLECSIVQAIITDTISELDLRRFQARFRTENACFLCITAALPVGLHSSLFHQNDLLLDILRQIKLCTKEAIAQDIGTCHIFIVSVNQDMFSVNMPQFIYELRCLMSAAYQKHNLNGIFLYFSSSVFTLHNLASEFKTLRKKIMKGNQRPFPDTPNSSAKIYALETEISHAISKGDNPSALAQAQILYDLLQLQSNNTPSLLCENLRDSLSALKRNVTTLNCELSFISELCNDLLATFSSYLEFDSMKAAFLHFIGSCCDYCKAEGNNDLETIDIKKIIEFIDDNFTHDFSLDQLASKYRVSLSFLSKALKHELGMNFIDYITKLRIGKAMYYLKHSDKTIKEITFAVGYNSQTYFCKVFKKMSGVSASEYKTSTNDQSNHTTID